MLALVHPVQHNSAPDAPHLTVPPPRTTRPSRKPNSVSSSSSTLSSTPASSSRPSVVRLQPPARHITAPVLPVASAAPAPSNTKQVRPHLAIDAPQSTSLDSFVPPQKRSCTPPPTSPPTFDIHSFPANELLKLLASLLTQIAAANDKLPTTCSSELTSPSHTSDPRPSLWSSLTTASRTAISTPSSTLSFHARNIPTISLEAYLLRILRYCPTTNEVFLSLLVYFDRMSKLSYEATGKVFVIDSYNIHRLVIAGVTVASKFFSDVFYTNSRYAKVGGLPQTELNQLELQFLLLNDFRLVISGTEMQHYAEQLILFSQTDMNSTFAMTSAGSRSPLPTAPMQAMGAIDAYGGRVEANNARTYGPDQPTSETAIIAPPAYDAAHTSSAAYPDGSLMANTTPPARPRVFLFSDDAEDTVVESDGTDSECVTDDEPTVRAGRGGHSRGSSICSESTWEDNDDSEYMEAPIKPLGAAQALDRSDRSDTFVGRDLTPERLGTGRKGVDASARDHRMASPIAQSDPIRLHSERK